MPPILRLRGFFFGLFTSILACAWVRASGTALGGDAYGKDLAAMALLLSFSAGAGLGSIWVRGTGTRWWPSFAVFGILGGLISFAIPGLTSALQDLYHNLGGGLASGGGLFFVLFLLAFLPWASGGVAFARMTAGADGEVITPVCFGAGAGLALVDFVIGPLLGGTTLLLVASAGILILAAGHDLATPLVETQPGEANRALAFAAGLGLLGAIALKTTGLFLQQFLPASRADQSWTDLLLVVIVALGAIGFGNPATVSRHPLLLVGFFVALAGSFVAVTAQIVHFLSSPARYLYYFSAFGAAEGSLLQGMLLVAAVAGLPALVLGAAVRCISDPVSSSGRPTTAAAACALGFGASAGILIGGFYAIPAFGIRTTAFLCSLLLAGFGLLGILVIFRGGYRMKATTSISALAAALLALPLFPGKLEVHNPYSPETLSIRETVEGSDGVARATREPGQITQLWWNHNPLTLGQEALEQMEVAFSVLLAQGPDEALSLSPLTPSRANLLGQAGIARLDLSPAAPILGELSLRICAENAKPLLHSFRAASGIPRQYPLIFCLSEPLWPVSATARWNEESLSALRRRLTENGSFVLWLRPREASAAALRGIARSFAEAFPSTSVFLALAGFEGPSFALVGRNRPSSWWNDPASMQELLDRLRNSPAFSSLPVRTVEDFEGLLFAHRERILETTIGSPRNRGPFPPLAWRMGTRFDPEQQAEGVEFLMALSTTGLIPTADGPSGADRDGAVRLLLSAFIEHIRYQAPGRGMLPPLEEREFSEGELRRFYEALKSWPTFTPALELWDLIGQRALQKKQFALCAAFLEKVAEVVPNRAHYLTMMGKALVALEKHEEAAKALRRAVSLEGKNPEALMILGVAYRRLGDGRRAAKTLEEARKYDPSNSSLLLELAFSYRDLEDPKRARSVAEEALKIAPQDGRILELLNSLSN